MSDSTPAPDNENDAKKLEGDCTKEDKLPASPSRVLHLRQIPSDATEAEIISLGLPFGKVTNILMLKGKSQAFLEMASEEAATAMMNYYTPSTPYLRSQPIYIQYSNHRELKIDNFPNQARAQTALQAVNTVQPGRPAMTNVLVPEGQGPVLRVIVDNLVYPITLDVLYQIFSRFGSVLKMITFTKNKQFQALLQYAEPAHAYYAKMTLDGRSIFSTYWTFRIDFSKLSYLRIKYNSDKSRDFTRLDLPFGAGHPPIEPFTAGAFGTPGTIFPPCAGPPGFVPHMGFAQAAGFAAPAFPAPLGSVVFTSGLPGQVTLPRFAGVPGSPVLLVSNLNPEAITPRGLFILFGVYGDVYRVKIMFKKKENALVQMADITQAQIAMNYLNGQRLYGRVLHTTFSKYLAVQLPRDGEDDQGLTKDYSNSPLHRFKKPGSKNFQNLSPPSSTLHLSNIPSSVTVDDMKKLFASTGATVKAFKFLQKDNKMALIQLDSVEEAIRALIELHDYNLGEDHHLRVSFSKTTI